MASMQVRSFESADEVREMDRTTVDVLRLPGGTVARFTFQPGWKWSECVGPKAGTETCQATHLGAVVSGNRLDILILFGNVVSRPHRGGGIKLGMCLPRSVVFVPAEHIFCEIRRVKTPAEIELLREAAQINEAACLAASGALRDGATWSELEDLYMAEMARRGGRGVYLSGGSGGLPDRRVRRGEPVMIDALGHYRRYHGDFGRSMVVGEPDDLLEKYGLTSQDIVSAAREAVAAK